MDPGRFSQYLIQFYSFVQFHQTKKKPDPKNPLRHKYNKKEKNSNAAFSLDSSVGYPIINNVKNNERVYFGMPHMPRRIKRR